MSKKKTNHKKTAKSAKVNLQLAKSIVMLIFAIMNNPFNFKLKANYSKKVTKTTTLKKLDLTIEAQLGTILGEIIRRIFRR